MLQLFIYLFIFVTIIYLFIYLFLSQLFGCGSVAHPSYCYGWDKLLWVRVNQQPPVHCEGWMDGWMIGGWGKLSHWVSVP